MTNPETLVNRAWPRQHALNDVWHVLPVEAFHQGFYPLDTQHWIEHTVPAHWQQHPLLENYAGKMVYRRQFSLPAEDVAPVAGRRWWLRFDGVFYWHQAFFNGVDLGRREGYFMPHEYEVTPWLAADNTLVVEVDCPEEKSPLAKRMVTGVFAHWDCLDPVTNPGGLWQPVHLLATGPQRINSVLLNTQKIAAEQATISYRAQLDSAEAKTVEFRWTITPKNFAGIVQTHSERVTLNQGVHEYRGSFRVRDPQLWWTHDLGDPNCYTISLAVVNGDEVSDQQAWTFGIRRFEMRNWIAYLNGVRFLIKGNNYAPGDTRIATTTRELYENDLRMALDAHMNLLRVHAHVEKAEFYELADLSGILIWQDFPLQWLYRREVLEPARWQVEQMTRLLGNHPAIVIWCMHNEPMYVTDTKIDTWWNQLKVYASVLFYNWNRDTLDVRLKQDVQALDPSRTVIRASGEFHIPLLQRGSDTHFYMGWYTRVYGALNVWERLVQRLPANIRFVTEFGAQSFPNRESCLKFMPSDPHQVDWDTMTERHQFQPGVLESNLPWREISELDELIQLTQSYQVAINRFYIDRLRYHKYRPTGGIVAFMFQDPNPAISFSIVDYWRVPKPAYAALKMAFSPQYVFTIVPQERYNVGQPIPIPIYVVNDEHREVEVRVSAQILGPESQVLAKIERTMTLPPDCQTLEADRLRLIPEVVGAYHVQVSLSHNGSEQINQEYAIIVQATEPAKR
jgi:beta-mannosidase